MKFLVHLHGSKSFDFYINAVSYNHASDKMDLIIQTLLIEFKVKTYGYALHEGIKSHTDLPTLKINLVRGKTCLSRLLTKII